MREQPREGRGQPREDNQPHAANMTGIGAAELGLRAASELQGYLRGLDYPADKSQLLEQARGQDAPENVLEAIGQFPEMEYNSPVHVAQMLDRLHH